MITEFVIDLAEREGVNIDRENPLSGLFNLFELLRSRGLVVLLKWDGERNPSAGDNGQYTAVITGAPLGESFFRMDADTLMAAINEVLTAYFRWAEDV